MEKLSINLKSSFLLKSIMVFASLLFMTSKGYAQDPGTSYDEYFWAPISLNDMSFPVVDNNEGTPMSLIQLNFDDYYFNVGPGHDGPYVYEYVIITGNGSNTYDQETHACYYEWDNYRALMPDVITKVQFYTNGCSTRLYDSSTHNFLGYTTCGDNIYPTGLASFWSSYYDGIIPYTKIRPSLETVVIPNTIRRIYRNIFRDFTALKNFDFSNIIDIQEYAFKNTGFTNLTFYHNMGTPVQMTRDEDMGYENFHSLQFEDCKNLESVTFTGDATSVPTLCFNNCTNLTTVNLGNVSKVGRDAFNRCPITSVDISKLDTIGPHAFYRHQLSEIEISANTKFVGETAFAYGSALTKVTIHRHMGSYAEMHNTSSSNQDWNNARWQFLGCPNLKEVVLDSEVTNLPWGCFSSCYALTDINLENITTYGTECLASCRNLVIDKTITDWRGKTVGLGYHPFMDVQLDLVHINAYSTLANTPDVTSDRAIFQRAKNSNIYIEDTNPTRYSKEDLIGKIGRGSSDSYDGWHSRYIPTYYDSDAKQWVDGDTTAVSNNNRPTNYVFVPASSLQTWRTAEGWCEIADRIMPWPEDEYEDFHVIIDGVKKYEGVDYAIGPNNTLTLVNMGTSRQGQNLTIPAFFNHGGVIYHVDSIGSNVCAGTPFTSVTLPTTVTALKNQAFAGMPNLTTINLENVFDIGEKVFYSCGSLGSVSLSNVWTSIGRSAFQGCTSLQTANLAAVTAGAGMGVSAFQGCTDLATVSLNSSLHVLPDSVFMDCTHLATITLSSLQKIGTSAFMNDSTLTAIDVASATILGKKSFAGSGLTAVTIPSGLITFEQAFMNCKHLTTVTPNGSLVDKEAFNGCIALEEVNLSGLSNNSIKLDNKAFANCTALDTLDFDKVRIFGDSCFYNCTSMNVEFDMTDIYGKYFGKEPFIGVTFSMLTSSYDNLNDYESSTNNTSTGLIDNALLHGAVNSTIRFTDKNYLYNVDEYLRKDPTTNKYVIEDSTFIYVDYAIWDDYQEAEGWEDVKEHILTWPPYKYYVIKDGEQYENVIYEENEDGENTLTLTYVNPEISDCNILEIPYPMEVEHKATKKKTAYTVTRIADGVFQNFFGSDGDHKVILPPSLKQIGNNAFQNCYYLNDINLDSVKVYGNSAFYGCQNLAIHADLRHATSMGSYVFGDCGLKSAWVGKTTGEYMFNSPNAPLNIYIAEEDPTQVNASHVTGGLDGRSVVYVTCRNIVSAENNQNKTPENTNPLQLFYENASWGNNGAEENEEIWQYVYPMLHQRSGYESERTYTTFCFDKPIDFRGTDEEGKNHGDGYTLIQPCYWEYDSGYLDYMKGLNEWDEYGYALDIRGMLQFYKDDPGYQDNRIEALVVTGFSYTPGTNTTPENGSLTTEPAGIRPAGTGVLIKWNSGVKYAHEGLTDYYPLPPVTNSDGYRTTQKAFLEVQGLDEDYPEYVPPYMIRKGTYENSAGEYNTGARNKERLAEYEGGETDTGLYRDNYPKHSGDEYFGGTTTLVNGTYVGSSYDNLLVGNTVRIDSVFYNPWYYRVTDDNHITHDNVDFDRRYKQFGLSESCYFRRFYKDWERVYDPPRLVGSFMRAYRAYLRLPMPSFDNSDSGAPQLNALFSIGGSSEGTTGILKPRETERPLTRDVYSLNGQKVSSDGLKGLPKGIYIMNGKKVVVK